MPVDSKKTSWIRFSFFQCCVLCGFLHFRCLRIGFSKIESTVQKTNPEPQKNQSRTTKKTIRGTKNQSTVKKTNPEPQKKQSTVDSVFKKPIHNHKKTNPEPQKTNPQDSGVFFGSWIRFVFCGFTFFPSLCAMDSNMIREGRYRITNSPTCHGATYPRQVGQPPVLKHIPGIYPHLWIGAMVVVCIAMAMPAEAIAPLVSVTVTV